MLTFPVQNLFIDGPDCAGKSTLIKKIHDISRYRWHITDRSQISRSVFNSLYKRDIPNISFDFYREVSNINNRFVLLIPDISVIKSRYDSRGDDIHKDFKSIKLVHDAFLEKKDLFAGFSNILFFSEENTDEIASRIASYLSLIERPLLREVSDTIIENVSHCMGECYPVEFTLWDDGKFEEASKDCFSYDKEAKYYQNIYNSLHKKISSELSGKNQYNRVETHSSRRFVHTEDTCISFIQVAVRDNLMDFNVVMRSADVETTFPHDLEFLYYLASTCYDRFSSYCNSVRMRFYLNSAHILNKII